MSNTKPASALAIGDTFINPRDGELVGPVEAVAEVEDISLTIRGGLMEQIGALPPRVVVRVPGRRHPVTLDADERVKLA